MLNPVLRSWGVDVTPLRRMGFGIAFSGFAWIAAGAIQLAIDGGDAVSIIWQVLPYVLLTFGEVGVRSSSRLPLAGARDGIRCRITIELRGNDARSVTYSVSAAWKSLPRRHAHPR
jgi:hypothetical protein